MKRKIITISIVVFLCINCISSNSKLKRKWIYSTDYSGLVYTGMIYNFEEEPYARYSLLFEDRTDSIIIKDKSLYDDTIRFAEIIWSNDNCLALKYHIRDTLLFHAVPKLNLSDSIDFVKAFLLDNKIEYNDRALHLEMDFDKKKNSELFYNVVISDMIFEESTFTARWNLKEINKSLILFCTSQSGSMFPDPLLVTSISKDSICVKRLRVPYNETVRVKKAISKGEDVSFKYESGVFRKKRE